jgi:hypothetical protein
MAEAACGIENAVGDSVDPIMARAMREAAGEVDSFLASTTWPGVHGALGPLVTEFEGTLYQFSGDGIMVFNDPVPCPDPAERAVKTRTLREGRPFVGIPGASSKIAYGK